MWEQATESFRRAAAANRRGPLRQGNVVRLPPAAELIVAGDLHGHGHNLLKLESLAGDLAANPRRHVVLQELVHRIPQNEDQAGQDDSHRALARVARWQERFPEQVHVILGNHELAQMTGQEILKSGAGICRAFSDAVAKQYGDESADVLAAMDDYFHSLPLAVRSADRVGVVHSLPANRHAEGFDTTVFGRPIEPGDYERTGPVYQLVWGRTLTRASIDRIRKALDVDLLVLGHQPQEDGLAVLDRDAIIIASDHARGVALRIPSGPAPTAEQLARSAVRLESVALA